MGYSSRNGRKPIERASKISHGEIVNNPEVVAFLAACDIPAAAAPSEISPLIYQVPSAANEIKAVIAIDGGFAETYVREEFPSSSLTFFTFGPLLFKTVDLERLEEKRFIAPEDLAVLKNLERYSIALPTRGLRLRGEPDLAASVRKTIYEFFSARRGPEQANLMRSLKWFLFRRWRNPPDDDLKELLARCPNPSCSARNIPLTFAMPEAVNCQDCGLTLYLTDAFRLHERVDDEQGAGGILTYVMTLLEQMVLVSVIQAVWEMKRSLLRDILFLKDGPLAFFGLVAPLYKPMRDLISFLQEQPDGLAYLYLAGIEKSGAFVDHAAAIQDQIPIGSVMIPDNEYIYRYIVPGDPNTGVYGFNTYYGQKIFYKSEAGRMHVLTVPTKTPAAAPKPQDFPNLSAILRLVADLKCDMYDNALLPIALANKLVSLSEFPSQRILTAFARDAVV